jgi:erythromycin esterase
MNEPSPARRLACLAVLVLAAGAALAAEDRRVASLREHAIPIASLDPGAPLDDLEPLRPALEGARVVLLGEATRGDGSAFLLKTRLIRFLYERLGFDLLLFECSLYDCARAWRDLRGGSGAREAFDGVLYPLYTEAAELQPLIELVAAAASSPRPLEVAGFDFQLGASAGTARLVSDLREALGGAELDTATRAALATLEPTLGLLHAEAYATGEAPVPPGPERQRFLDALEQVRGRLVSLREPAPSAARESEWWLQVVGNLETWARASWMLGRFDPRAPISTELHNLRDRRMAENLLWLVRRDPQRKVVVTSLTVHLARDLDRLATGDETMRSRLGEMSAVGDLVARELGDQAYTIAITAAEGRSGTPFRAPYDLLAPTVGSFEDLMARAGFEAAFVDLRGATEGARWLRRGFLARPISYVELYAVWPRHLDGLLFLRRMEPVRRVR